MRRWVAIVAAILGFGASADNDLYVATRPSVDAPFDAATRLVELSTIGPRCDLHGDALTHV